MPSSWTRLRDRLDPYARSVGLYTAYELDSAEYVGTYDGDLDALLALFAEGGYEPQRLSAAKRHPETGQLHDASLRRVPTMHPRGVPTDAAIREWRPRFCQFHAHLFDLGSAGVDVFSHFELRPDFSPIPMEHPGETFRRLREHYRPQRSETYLEGVTDVDFNPE